MAENVRPDPVRKIQFGVWERLFFLHCPVDKESIGADRLLDRTRKNAINAFQFCILFLEEGDRRREIKDQPFLFCKKQFSLISKRNRARGFQKSGPSVENDFVWSVWNFFRSGNLDGHKTRKNSTGWRHFYRFIWPATMCRPTFYRKGAERLVARLSFFWSELL